MVTDTAKPTGRRAAQQVARREAILKAARTTFLERGYAATSMSAVLDMVGGSKTTLWKNFRSKEELFAAVIDDLCSELRADLDVDALVELGLGRGLTSFCAHYIGALERPDMIATWRMLTSEGVRFPEVGKIFHERAVEQLETLLGAMLERFVAKGALVPRPVTEMVDVLLALCSGRQQRMMWGEQGSRPLDQLAATYAEVFIRAYGPGAPC